MGIIRLLLALSVVVAHCGKIGIFSLVSATTAVESFYIISGFYMSLIINEKYIGVNNSFKLFITNRFLRLFPIYWAVLLLTILVYLLYGIVSKSHYYPTFNYYFSVFPNPLSFGYLIITNIILFGQDLAMFIGINPAHGNLFFTNDFWLTKPPLYRFLFIPQAWTLGIELTFYLIAPFILKRGLKVVVPLMVLSILLRMYLYHFLKLNYDPWTYRFFPTEVFFFLLGYLSYRISVKLKKISIKKGYSYGALAFISAISIIYPLVPPIESHLLFKVNDIFYFACITVGMPVLFNVFKKSKLDIEIGDLSYPVYISHMLVFFVVSVLPFSILKNGFTVALATIIFSFMLNKFIADPIDKFRQARLTK